jgi:hypothetical protein
MPPAAGAVTGFTQAGTSEASPNAQKDTEQKGSKKDRKEDHCQGLEKGHEKAS